MKNTESKIDAALGASRRRPYFNVLRVASPVKEGETITFGTDTFELDTTGAVTAGNIAVSLLSAASLVAAAITGTFSGVGTANDTITVAGVVYKLVDALTGAANEILIADTAAHTRDNFVAGVNAAAGAGTTYGLGTVANPSVSAAASSTADVILTARIKGTAGNSIAISESGTGFSFAGAATVLAGGTDTSASDFTTIFVAAVAASSARLNATRISANEVLVVDLARDGGVVKACTETLAGSNNVWASANSYAGAPTPTEFASVTQIARVPNATELALNTMHFFFNFAPVNAIVQVRTSAGVYKGWDGAAVITGNRLTLTSSGSTNIATNDVVTVQVSS